ncbi:organ-specific protein P4-like isoform X2 [Lycium barbarum]|uniref:organ-specific protein P4-like isoform X2 n=1 Tax=Lycium barbarum TaxID=112863 RepID=UPI00293EF981|nr:organ-specific protein P4-like isoform X2 [Lycium barbarum]
MKSIFALILLISLALYASTTNARRDPGEYWRIVMKNEPMPVAIQRLMPRHTAPFSKENTNRHTSSSVDDLKLQEEQSFSKHFKPRPTVTAYYDDDAGEKFVAKDFESRPTVTAYYHDDDGLEQEISSFAKDFEPRPTVTAYYHDGARLKKEKLSFAQDFEPRPTAIAYYHEDAGLKQEKSSFAKDLELRPTAS